MHKKSIYLSKIFIIFILLFGLTVDISISEATSKNNKDSIMIKQEFICMIDQDYETLHSFVKQNIAQTSPELAGQMVQNLILSSEKMLTPSADYIYSKNYKEIRSTILLAIPKDIENPAVICGSDKEKFIKNLPNGEIKNKLSKWLHSGLCLRNLEGTYFFAIDYPEYLEKYSLYTDEATTQYLNLCAKETIQPTVISEILTIDIQELNERAITYEKFLKDYPNFPMNEIIYANFNTTISKLINPTIYDNLIDTNGHVSKDLLVIYQNLSKQDNYPILQYIGQEMLQFINNQPNNIVYQDYTSDKLSSNASIIYKKVHQLLNELYTSHI